MKSSIQGLKAWLKEHPLQLQTANEERLSVDLYWYYVENNPCYTVEKQRICQQAREQLALLKESEEDAAQELFGDMYTKQEQLAFRCGLHMGMHLAAELMETP